MAGRNETLEITRFYVDLLRGMSKAIDWQSILSFLLPFAVYLLTLNSAGGQSYNIVGMQSSMLQTHSLNVVQPGIDLVEFNGSLYNVYAPGFAFLSFPFAAFGFFSYNSLFGYFGNAAFMDEVFLAICASLTGVIVYRICRFYSGKYASLISSLTLTLGTSVLPFAVSVFPHDCAMPFSTLAVYLVLANAKSKHPNDVFLFLAGVSLGIATLTEYATGLFFPALIVYVFYSKRKTSVGKNSITRSLAGLVGTFSLVGIGLNLLYNYILFGNPLSFPQSLASSGTHFFIGLSLLEHFVYYLASPDRGIFILSPVLALGVVGLLKMCRSKFLKSDALLFLSLILADMLFYSAWQAWDGAWAYGPRFLIIVLPYLAVPVSLVLSGKYFGRLFLILFFWSSAVQLAGAVAGPSAPGINTPLLFQFTSYAIPQIFQGASSVQLLESLLPGSSFGDVAYFLLVLAFIWLSVVKVFSRLRKDNHRQTPEECNLIEDDTASLGQIVEQKV